MRKLAIVDADSILYAIAVNAQADMGPDEPPLMLLTEDQAIKEARWQIEEIVDTVDAHDGIICISDAKNWRKKIYPPYKSNRVGKPKPVMLAALNTALLNKEIVNMPSLRVPWLEADDLVGISAGQIDRGKKTSVIVSIDKDLWTVPGLHWNPRPDNFGKARPEEYVSREQADRNHLYQALTGDTVDGYPGCPGIGPVRANQFLDEYEDYAPEERWRGFVQLFEDKGLTEQDALVQAQIARILRVSDWDAKGKKIKLWQPPKLEDKA